MVFKTCFSDCTLFVLLITFYWMLDMTIGEIIRMYVKEIIEIYIKKYLIYINMW